MSESLSLDPVMNSIARTAVLTLLEAHVQAVRQVLAIIGSNLDECDLAALDDHLAAMQRLTKTLGAGSVA